MLDHRHTNMTRARQILQNLKGRITPRESGILNCYTVGDVFFRRVFGLKEEIVKLLEEPGSVERIIIGDFGTGKSHFLRYLNALVSSDLNNSPHHSASETRIAPCLITYVELEELSKPSDFQMQLIRRMHIVGGQGDWFKILTNSYRFLREQVKQSRNLGLITSRNVEQFIALVLFTILEDPSHGFVSRGLFEYLASQEWTKEMALRLPYNRLDNEFRKAIGIARYEYRLFVEAFISASIHPTKRNHSILEEIMIRLSEQKLLTDVVFRVLALAGIELVVILVDELEVMQSRADGSECLDSIKQFRDKLDIGGKGKPNLSEIYAASECGYPSIAFICASTELFFDRQLEPMHQGLHHRWRDSDKHVRLEQPSATDIDYLIFKLRELFYSAGKKLRSVQTDDVKEMREANLAQLREDLRDAPITMRDIISKLISTIESEHLVQ